MLALKGSGMCIDLNINSSEYHFMKFTSFEMVLGGFHNLFYT